MQLRYARAELVVQKLNRRKLKILLYVFALLSVISLLSVYFTHQLPTEETKTTTLFTYKHVSTHDPIAKLESNFIYNQSTLKPGEATLYTEIIEYINNTFTYTFETSLEANITIEHSTTMRLESSKWGKTFDTSPQTELNSAGTVTSFSNNYLVNISQVRTLEQTLEKETRAPVSDYNVTIRPEIHIMADNSITTIDEYFTPTLSLAFKHGASQGNYISITGLEHTTPKTITDTKRIPRPEVTNQRYASYGFFATLLVLTTATSFALYRKKVKNSQKPEKLMEEIVAPYQEVIAESAGEPSYKGQTAIVPMKSLEDLVKVADWIGKPVLSSEKASNIPSKSTRVFYVLDGTTRYECTITAPTTAEKEEEELGRD